jgi:DNA-directed RNA polymerase specialized sigma24 family protein
MAHKKKNEAVKKTKALMANYRAMQAYVGSQVQPEDQEGQEDTRRLLGQIDAALVQIAQDYAAVGEDQKMVAFRLKYIDGKTYEQIAEQMETHENTPHNWINQINKRLAVYLYGVQALR